MSRPAFQRAREPEEKEQRRRALLGAAARLLAAEGLPAVTLSAIAREADLAKSNVYRYFGSREEILLEILIDGEAAWVSDLERALARWGTPDIDKVAHAVAHTLVARPVTCALIASVANVLEHNLTAEAVRRFKERTLELSIRLGNALRVAIPALRPDATERFLRYLHALVAGLWPMAHPAPLARDALRDPAFRSMRSDLETDLRGSVAALLRGLTTAGC